MIKFFKFSKKTRYFCIFSRPLKKKNFYVCHDFFFLFFFNMDQIWWRVKEFFCGRCAACESVTGKAEIFYGTRNNAARYKNWLTHFAVGFLSFMMNALEGRYKAKMRRNGDQIILKNLAWMNQREKKLCGFTSPYLYESREQSLVSSWATKRHAAESQLLRLFCQIDLFLEFERLLWNFHNLDDGWIQPSFQFLQWF